MQLFQFFTTSAPFSLWSGPSKNAGLLPQLLLGEDLHCVVGVVLLVVRQLHNPIAALAHHPLEKQLKLCLIKRRCAHMHPNLLIFRTYMKPCAINRAKYICLYLKLVLVELDVVSVLFARHSLCLFQRLSFHPKKPAVKFHLI